MKRTLHIALVAASPAVVGGHSVQATALAAQLSTDGYEVSYIPIDVRFPRRLQWIRRFRYVRTVVNELLYVLSLVRLRRSDVVHVFSASYWSFLLGPAPAVIVARLLRKPVVLHYHSGEADDHLNRWRASVRPLLRLVNEIVVPSRYLEEIFTSHGYRTRVIHNLIETWRFTYRERASLQPRLLSTRNLEPHYGVDMIIRAFALLKGRFPDAGLTIVGEGRHEPALRTLVNELGIDGIDFLGRVDPAAMPAVYDAADIFVNASVVDNQPVSILEAFASGLPVVSTPTGDIVSMLVGGEAGLLVNSGDVSGLAAAVTSLLENPQLSLRLTRRAGKQLEQYASAAVGEQWRSVYHGLLPVLHCEQEVLVNGI